jgi:hypothetical protein
MLVHTCNSSIWEGEAGGFQVWAQPMLHRKTVSKIYEWLWLNIESYNNWLSEKLRIIRGKYSNVDVK